jgi:hypothetical protein
MTYLMNESQITGRLSWLSDLLVVRRNHLQKLFLRLRDIGVRAGNSLALHRKFIRLMEQVAFDREKELDLINEIEDVEKRHHELRKRNLLKRADVKHAAKADPATDEENEDDAEREDSGFSLMKILALLYFLSPRRTKRQIEEPKVD